MKWSSTFYQSRSVLGVVLAIRQPLFHLPLYSPFMLVSVCLKGMHIEIRSRRAKRRHEGIEKEERQRGGERETWEDVRAAVSRRRWKRMRRKMGTRDRGKKERTRWTQDNNTATDQQQSGEEGARTDTRPQKKKNKHITSPRLT